MLEEHNTTLAQDVHKLRHAVSETLGSVDILSFARRYAPDSEIVKRAALLQYAARSLGDVSGGDEELPNEAPDLAFELMNLIEVIVAANAAGYGERAIREREEVLVRLRDYLRQRAPANEIVFKGQELAKRFEHFELHGVSLELRLGEITGVVGENAQGKTTLLRLVAGDLAPTAGEISYPAFAQQAGAIDWFKVKQQTAFVPQELPHWGGSLRDTLHFEASLHGITGRENQAAVDFIVERLGLRNHLGMKWHHLSGGFRLRFSLARALVWRPRLLILDEPLANLDMRAKAALMKDLRDLSSSYTHPIAVVLSSHDIQNVESVCSSILFLRGGRSEYFGETNAVCQDENLNVFEVSCSLDVEALSDRLNDTGFTVRESMLRTLLETPKSVGAAEVLRTLLDRQVDLVSFRDISRSVRRLFDQVTDTQ
ncbi:ATP-binding cassette domain-containing protein [Variovorax sp.]|jgi:ABC-2 type transport system ATP-binding protein|uniref:ABC transporter ATP-binding protein n=1 Tax=Variovorax sp. TaxID=1871043 RepID=UPI0037DA7222